MTAVRARELTIAATDGYPLAATLFGPVRGEEEDSVAGGPEADRVPDRIAVLAPALGVKRAFYEPYASHLAGRGLPVLSFDYRGIGGSRPERIQELDTSLREWGESDLAGVLRWVRQQWPRAEVVYVAHSVGAQLLGLIPEAAEVRAMLALTPGTAYWKLWPLPQRYLLFLLWHLVIPVTVSVLSYFPARIVGLGEDLPGGAALQWARWARHPAYMVDGDGEPLRAGCHAFGGSVLAYSFTDDWQNPRDAAEHMLGFYVNASVDHRHLSPGDLGLERVSHFGFFREKSRSTLWRESSDWLLTA